MRYEIRPLGPWVGEATRERLWHGRFRADWPSTLRLLGRETDLLGATMVVVLVDVHAGEIRRDGMLRADAKVRFPGVRVSFDSHHGPLTYATDQYDEWRANVRAIALALEALRAVDRYGVSRAGQQYSGWKAIAAGPAAQVRMTSEQAAELLAAHSGDRFAARAILDDPAARDRAFKAAAARAHPDVPGGDRDTWDRLNAARHLLAALERTVSRHHTRTATILDRLPPRTYGGTP